MTAYASCYPDAPGLTLWCREQTEVRENCDPYLGGKAARWTALGVPLFAHGRDGNAPPSVLLWSAVGAEASTG